MESPLSESYATLRISEIQKRFVELMQEDNNDLRLEDSDADDGSTDPYNRRR